MRADDESFAARSQRLVDDLTARRYVVLVLIAAAIWLDTARAVGWQGDDWHFFLSGAHAATGSAGLHLYARMPYLQFGPLALLVPLVFRDAGPGHGWAIVSALGMLLGLGAIRLLEGTARKYDVGQSIDRVVLLGGPFFLLAWASPAVTRGHPDDVLALFAIVASMRAVASRKWLLASVLIGLAAAAKPWALLALPLAAACQEVRLRGVVVAGLAAAIPWLPFFVVDPATRRVGQFHLRVEQPSTLHYLGLAVGSTPTWPREAQLGLGLVLAAIAVARGRWVLVPIVAFAVRVNLDPSALDYYAAGPVLGALAWDVFEPIRRLPVRTFATWFALLLLPSSLLTAGSDGSGALAVIVVLRVAVLLVAVWAAVRPGPAGRQA